MNSKAQIQMLNGGLSQVQHPLMPTQVTTPRIITNARPQTGTSTQCVLPQIRQQSTGASAERVNNSITSKSIERARKFGQEISHMFNNLKKSAPAKQSI
jgi:hypothetical protein